MLQIYPGQVIQTTLFTPHMVLDFLYYVAFVCGQCLFILKRSASAIRSKTNPIKTRRDFVYQNWDVLLIRMAIEAGFFFIYRHYDLNTVLSLFTAWKFPFAQPQGAFVSFGLGFLCDSLLDWLGASGKVPIWLREAVPNVQVSELKTMQTETQADGTSLSVEQTVRVEKTAPPEEKTQ